ncbi:MAG: hypothetical protein QHC77_14225 [Stenotrophomonas sp.]|uniref:hypothetical protein n=1 Tax=Stenotrophomonas sp. TaxID=69392 RepID=UPI0029B93A9B|nr:hypothetical protein [Stenotrophomonas sp.]MDX3933087.1 hypothetical protein [Stenotrophomonas sp.]
MLPASANILSTTSGRLSSTALLRPGLRQISAAGLAPAPVPRHVVNCRPGRIANHQLDLGGLRAVRENAMRFWQGQPDPLSLVRPAPSPQRPQAHPQPPRPLYGALPLPPSRVFALARYGPWQRPQVSAPPRIVEAVRKRFEPSLDLESWLCEQQIVVRREEHHPLGLLSLQGLPLLERNTSHGSEPWPSRTSTSVVRGTVARAVALKQARDAAAGGGSSAWKSITGPLHGMPGSPDSGLSLCASDDEDLAAEAVACARQMAARRRDCPDMQRLDDLLRGLIPRPSVHCPHPPHSYPTRPQKSELHPYGIHRKLVGAAMAGHDRGEPAAARFPTASRRGGGQAGGTFPLQAKAP